MFSIPRRVRIKNPPPKLRSPRSTTQQTESSPGGLLRLQSREKSSVSPLFNHSRKRFIFVKKNTCDTMSVPIGSHHPATETPARAARDEAEEGGSSTRQNNVPPRCVCVKVHQRARRLKFSCLGMPCVALIRRAENQRPCGYVSTSSYRESCTRPVERRCSS